MATNLAATEGKTRPSWSDLPLAARLFRVAHGAWGVFNMAGLAFVWRGAVTRRRDRLAYAATGLLLTEGAALIVGRGNCPFGPLQTQMGDPVPMFEWLLPPRAAKAAILVLTLVTLGGLALMWLRPPK
ncbi:MAG: hypothetical protein ABI452_05535 [Candidatus Limnocylindrales bacterium]